MNRKNLENFLTPSKFRIFYDESNACKNGCDDVVEKFLEFGQDPDCIEQKSVDTPLNLALNNGCRKIAELLLTNGADPNSADEKGRTPLHALCSRGVDDDLAEKFFQICDAIDQTVQVDAVDNAGVTPLRCALVSGTKRTAEVLLRRGADPNVADEKGLTALYFIALREIDDDLPEMFFQICDDIQQAVQIDIQDEFGRTPLHLALENGHRKLTELLLRRGADPNLVDEQGFTALQHILLYENINVYDLAGIFFEICDDIQQPVKLDVRDKGGRTPLFMALRKAKKNVSELLLRRGADPNVADENGLTALYFLAVREIDDDLPEMFFQTCDDIQQAVQIDIQDKFGRTPLHLALENGLRKLTELLLRRGADPNLVDEQVFTALHHIALRDIDDDLAEMFFQICDDIQQTVKLDFRDKDGQIPLHLALMNGHSKLTELLLRRGADPKLADEQGFTALHHIALREIDDDLAGMFFQICDDIQQTVILDFRDEDGQTPLHLALVKDHSKLTELLLRRGADPNLADEEGFAALHRIALREIDDDLAEMFFQICDDIQQTVQVNTLGKLGRTPLHLAVRNGHRKLTELLLRRGADPNLVDEHGFTALHHIAYRKIDDDLAGVFFKICDDIQQTVKLEVRDMWGLIPLNSALSKGKKNLSELLMRKGVDLNSTSNEGSTPLHFICMYCKEASFLAKILFELSDERNHPLQVDARDVLHQTPLHHSVNRGLKEVTELLLRRGADPNLATENGFTPLHVICMRYREEELVEIFLNICDDVQQTVQINVQDKLYQTPLQRAVANLMLNAVDSLVDRGADLSSFMFPTIYPEWLRDDNCKLTLASGLMAVVERLENRGYELDRSDALTIMELFHNYELFEKAADVDEYWYDDEKFATEAKKVMIYPRIERFDYDDEAEFAREKNETMMSPSLSIYDLVRLRPDEVAKLLIYEDYLVHPKKINKSTSSLSVACLVHLCEKLSRRFFRAWATISFYELIHNRLSIECLILLTKI
ncbi:unnamed protein product [Trichogramma brassicae]|uniref:Uncharacterized protein n=1 Tax=Trichogramma brassicae TaxID=86971 RepID=A0A6H5IX70_9HYME|nr:unnamed protein product [Trichogramma brassicae]